MRSLNLSAIENIMIEVAQSEIMPCFRQLAPEDIEMKGINDPVTVADKAAENALIARLTDYLPGSTIVGEESYAKDKHILSRLGGDSDVWVIDPIDGTRNFVSGRTEFAVMIALVRNKQTIAAWIHDPNTGDTLMAEQGAGVHLGGHKMHLAGQDASVKPIGLLGLKFRKIFAQPHMAAIHQRLPECIAGSSSAAFDYARMFAGERNFANIVTARTSFLMVSRTAMPWDHLAGLMMMHEEGGYGRDWQGKVYEGTNPYQGLLATASHALWEQLQGVLGSVLASPEAP